MPIFDYVCQNCANRFDLIISNSKKDGVKCPKCGSANVQQLLSLFNTGSTRKIADNCASCNKTG
ncbi:MAG: zinc ribbon domain-containing protein [Syntrophomonadaceae bacterium]|nr:zinc ribbon domain-containing protein [Syntrophomonadaceae bacterium]